MQIPSFDDFINTLNEEKMREIIRINIAENMLETARNVEQLKEAG